jgi:hypothetical protein
MNINDNVLHERQVFAYLDESDLNRLIIEYIAKTLKLDGKALNGPDAVVKCNILTKYTSTRAAEPYAEVTINIPVIEVVPAGPETNYK